MVERLVPIGLTKLQRQLYRGLLQKSAEILRSIGIRVKDAGKNGKLAHGAAKIVWTSVLVK